MAARSIFKMGEEFGCNADLILTFLQASMSSEDFSKLNAANISMEDKAYNFLKKYLKDTVLEFFRTKGYDFEELSDIDWFELLSEDFDLTSDFEDFVAKKGIRYSFVKSDTKSKSKELIEVNAEDSHDYYFFDSVQVKIRYFKLKD